MQMSYGLYRRFLVDLAYLKELVVNAFQVVSFTRKKRLFKRTSSKCIPSGLIYAKETPSSTKRKVVKDNQTHGIKATFLPEKLSKFNSTLHSDLLIECQIKNIVRKISRAVFVCHRSLMAPCKIIQYYDQATVVFDF